MIEASTSSTDTNMTPRYKYGIETHAKVESMKLPLNHRFEHEEQ